MAPESFRANTVTAALEEVQRKLGPNALVVSVRQLPADPAWQVWREPMVEVLALPAGDTSYSPEIATEDPKSSPVAPASAKSRNNFLESLYAATPENISTEPGPTLAVHAAPAAKPPTIKPAPIAPAPTFTAAARPTPAKTAPFQSTSVTDDRKPAEGLTRALTAIRNHLITQGVDATMVQRMVAECKESLSVAALASEDRLFKFLSAQMQAVIRVRQPSMVMRDRVVCMVGTSGAGKTSMCAKLAAYHQNLGRKVTWISVDTFKAGAISEAQFYTSALSVPLQIAYTPEELAFYVSEAVDSDLVLVDTQKVNPYQEGSLVHLLNYLTTLEERSIYLTFSANSKEADMNQALSALRPFKLAGLVFTHLDETNSFGNLFNLSWGSRLPLIYFSKGTRVLDDLIPAQVDFLTQFIFDGKAVS
jgi:flagellar biosynthesis GTPase FlhF